MDGKSMLDAVSLRASGIFRVVDGQVTLGELVAGSSRYPLRCDRLEIEIEQGIVDSQPVDFGELGGGAFGVA